MLMVAVVTLAACAAPQRVQVDSLVAEPQQFTGEEIEVCGWFVLRMEVCSLSPHPNYEETSIWVLPRTEACLPKNWFENPRAEWALVSGRVQTGGGFGHLGMYQTVLVGGAIRKDRECGPPRET